MRRSTLTLLSAAAVAAGMAFAGAPGGLPPEPPLDPGVVRAAPAGVALQSAAVSTAPGVPVRLADVPLAPPAAEGMAPFAHIQGEYRLDTAPATGPGTPGAGAQFPPAEPPRAPAPSRGAGDGVASWDGLAATGWIPPDTILAVGPGHVVEATNSEFIVYTKTGSVARPQTSFDAFFDPVKPAGWAGFMFDPRVVYALSYQKYAMIALGKDDTNQRAYCFLGISQTDDPTGAWWLWRFDQISDAWWDYASLGADNWGLYLTGNYFYWAGGFKYAVVWRWDNTLFDGGGANGTVWSDLRWPNSASAFGLQVIHAHSTAGGNLTFFANTHSGSGNQVELWTLDHDDNSLTNVAVPSSQYYAIYEQVDQPGSTTDIDGGDARVLNGVYAQRNVFVTLTTDVNNDNAQSGAYVGKMDVDTDTMEWQTILWATGSYLFYPAITIAGGGSTDPVLAVAHSWASPPNNTFASGATKLYTNHPAGTDGPWTFAAAGLASYVNLDSNNVNRWGDYSGAVYDWSTGLFWDSVEYAGTGNTWRTRITAWRSADAATTVTYPNGGETLTHGQTVTVTWNHSNLNPSFSRYVLLNNEAGDSVQSGALAWDATSYAWYVPNAPSTQSRIWVCSWNGTGWEACDLSDAVFTVSGCAEDGFEGSSDDSPATSVYLVDGSPQAHSLCPIGDEDWVTFNPVTYSAPVLETSGSSGDTVLTLYHSNLAQVGYNDDWGSLFSRVERSCELNPLYSDAYYVRVAEFGSNGFIDSYTLSRATASCPNVLFFDDFDLQGSGRWSVTSP